MALICTSLVLHGIFPPPWLLGNGSNGVVVHDVSSLICSFSVVHGQCKF